MAKVGVAYIEIKPDLSGFAEELKAKLAAQRKSHVDVEVKPDMDRFGATLSSALSKAKPDGANRLGEKLGAQVSEAAAGPMINGLSKLFLGFPEALSNPYSAAATAIGVAFAGALAAALIAALLPLLAGISLVGLGLFGAAQHKEVQEAATKLALTFKNALAKATAGFKPQTLVALDILSKAITQSFATLTPVFDALAPLVPVLAQAFAELAQVLAISLADPGFVAIMKDLLTTFIKFLPMISVFLAELFRLIRNYGPETKLILKTLLDVIVTVMIRTIEVINAVLATIRFLRNTWDEASKAMSAAWKAVGSVASSVSQSMGRAVLSVTSTVQRVISEVSSWPRRILAAVGNLGSLLYSAGASIVDGLANGIRNSWGRVSSAVNALLSKIPAAVRKLMGIGSPSKVMARLGREIPRGLALGITKESPAVTGALKDMMGLPRAQAPIGSIAAQGSATQSMLAVLSIDGKFFDLRVEQLIAASSDGAARDLLAGRRSV